MDQRGAHEIFCRGGERKRSAVDLFVGGVEASDKDAALDGCRGDALCRRSIASEVRGGESELDGIRVVIVNSERRCASQSLGCHHGCDGDIRIGMGNNAAKSQTFVAEVECVVEETLVYAHLVDSREERGLAVIEL